MAAGARLPRAGLVALLLGAASLGAASDEARAERIQAGDLCQRILIGSLPEAPQSRSSFSVNQIEDVTFFASFPKAALERERVAEVTLRNPNGHVYSTRHVPIARDSGRSVDRRAERSTRSLPGYPFPVEEQRPEVVVVRGDGTRAPSHREIGVHLPALLVAGTDIVRSSLYGTWSIRVTLDGETDGCSARFRLAP